MKNQKQYLIGSLMVITLLLLSTFHTNLYAQYFGQNKVRYEHFNFQIMKTKHFDVYFYPEEADIAKTAGRMAERWYTRHSEILDHDLRGRQPLILYASGPQFQGTNTTQGQVGQGVQGFTEPLKRRVVVSLGASLRETNHVIGHELVHAFQYDMSGESGDGEGENPSMQQMPLWFIEGMAEFLSLGPKDPLTAMWMRSAVESDKKLPSIKALNNPKYFPYRWGQALLSYIAGQWGDASIGDMLRAANEGNNIDDAIQEVLGISADSLSTVWHAALRQAYSPMETVTDTTVQNATLLIGGEKDHDLNVSPAISPDGSKMIFFSSKSLFAIDLYLADVSTGKIIRKITHTESNPHYQSLEFINSSGTWSPDGKQIAIGSITKERPNLTILNVENGKQVRNIHFPHLGEILSPAWSPNGRYIAFSALSGGKSDLFIYDLQADSLQQLTDDLYAELQPAWSPDGRTLTLVTDRYSANVSDINVGNYELATYDVTTHQMKHLPVLSGAKHINPQWSSDGQWLYFLSDPDGITNLYKVQLSDMQPVKVTNLYTGISGITSLSPALSVAQKSNRIIYSVFENGNYRIYKQKPEEQVASTASNSFTADPMQTSFDMNPAYLPYDTSGTDTLVENLRNPQFGLPPDTTYGIKPYRPVLHLLNVGSPYLFGGGSQYGYSLGGGASLYWSDMLGYQNLATMLQIQSENGFTDIAAAVNYINNSHRLLWGGTVQQIPYVYRYYAAGYGNYQGNPALIDQEIRYKEQNRDVSVIGAYPFNQAARLELSGGYRQISFTQETRSVIYDAQTGNIVKKITNHLPSPSPLNLFYLTPAFVYDYSFFGATGPILGQRYRLQVSPNIGNIRFYSALADYRRYFMPLKPFTLAFRLMHYGRYGKGSQDNRLIPIFLGYQSFIRGYNYLSFGSNNPTFNELLGSRIGVFNAELRFPLFGLLGLGKSYYGILPVETGVFYDAGIAWDNTNKPWVFGGDRRPLTSYGLEARINLLGYIVAEVDLVNPVNRPKKGWYWQFGFNTGF